MARNLRHGARVAPRDLPGPEARGGQPDAHAPGHSDCPVPPARRSQQPRARRGHRARRARGPGAGDRSARHAGRDGGAVARGGRGRAGRRGVATPLRAGAVPDRPGSRQAACRPTARAARAPAPVDAVLDRLEPYRSRAHRSARALCRGASPQPGRGAGGARGPSRFPVDAGVRAPDRLLRGQSHGDGGRGAGACDPRRQDRVHGVVREPPDGTARPRDVRARRLARRLVRTRAGAGVCRRAHR